MGGGWVVGLGFCKIKANSAQLELELGLSLAIQGKGENRIVCRDKEKVLI